MAVFLYNTHYNYYLKAENIPPKIAKTKIRIYKETIIKVKIPKNL